MNINKQKLDDFEEVCGDFLQWDFSVIVLNNLKKFFDSNKNDLTEGDQRTLQEAIKCINRRYKHLENRFFNNFQ